MAKKKVEPSQQSQPSYQSAVVEAVTSAPVSQLQLEQLQIKWSSYESVRPNNYNPNSMTWHERMLLRQSLLEDGWTQPVVTLPPNEAGVSVIVDGEQRWTTAGIEVTPDDIQAIISRMEGRKAAGFEESESIIFRLRTALDRLIPIYGLFEKRFEAHYKANGNGFRKADVRETFFRQLPARERPCIAAITGGLVPITHLDLGDEAHKIISTIRHNRARGIHGVDSMASLTKDLVQMGLDLNDLEERLGMDDEEVHRFLKSAEGQVADIQEQLAATDFSAPVEIAHVANLAPDAQMEAQRSAGANANIKAYQVELAQHQAGIQQVIAATVKDLEAQRGKAISQDERLKIAAKIAGEAEAPAPPTSAGLKKLMLFLSDDEHALAMVVLGERAAEGLMTLVRAEAIKRGLLPVPPSEARGVLEAEAV